jgi:hypothetical protein
MTNTTPPIPEIPEAQLTELVQQLLAIIDHQQKQIEELHEEIRRLKDHKGKPQLKPSQMDKEMLGEEKGGGRGEAQERSEASEDGAVENGG